MTRPSTSWFDLPAHLTRKADPALITADEQHFAAVAAAVTASIDELSTRLDTERAAPARGGQQALDRDTEIHRLTARLRTLRRFGVDLCLGRMVPAADGDPVYIGRLGLTDADGNRLLVDWRSPAAEPFFAATHAHPMGLLSRRRYRWIDGRIRDYWDEVFTADALTHPVALDDESAFIASLGSSRSPRMRDVLGTIQADQDAIIRAGSRGALVVDGGPGTGKTVVALHRAAYLLYADPRLGQRRGGVLFVGPHQPYLDYVADVLPSLGEDGVQTCTLRDLVPEGTTASSETDPEVTRLKASADLVRAIEQAVRFYEEPPTQDVIIETPWTEIALSADDWADAFAVVEPGTPHNEARDEILDELMAILIDRVIDRVDVEVGPELLRQSLMNNHDLVIALNRAWPLLDPADVIADLWTVPAYLRMAAPWLTADEVRTLQRADGRGWTDADLPLLDAARRRLGDPDAARRRRQNAVTAATQRAEMDQVVSHLIESDDSEMRVMSMLRGADLQDALVDPDAQAREVHDPLAGPFAHVVVDEAQELTDAQWQMILARCPSLSVTVVGDRAQARCGFAESWAQRLQRVGFEHIQLAGLTVNYRTPHEVMIEAEPVIKTVLPDANVPTSIRRTGQPVRHASTREFDAILGGWLADHDGTACVITVGEAGISSHPRVRRLTPELVKGLEFDLVVLIDPERFGTGIAGAVDRYVAMTRATQQLIVLRSDQ